MRDRNEVGFNSLETSKLALPPLEITWFHVISVVVVFFHFWPTQHGWCLYWTEYNFLQLYHNFFLFVYFMCLADVQLMLFLCGNTNIPKLWDQFSVLVKLKIKTVINNQRSVLFLVALIESTYNLVLNMNCRIKTT